MIRHFLKRLATHTIYEKANFVLSPLYMNVRITKYPVISSGQNVQSNVIKTNAS